MTTIVPCRLDFGLLRPRRLTVDVHVFDLHVLRLVGVGVETVAEAAEVGVEIVDGELHRRVERLQHLDRLLRQAVGLVLGQVPALVLPDAEIVDCDDDAERDQDADEAHRPVARLPLVEERDDVLPLPEHVDQDADEPGAQDVVEVRQPALKIEAPADADGAEDQRDADPPDDADNLFHHQPRHRSLSTALAVRNSPNAMKLR